MSVLNDLELTDGTRLFKSAMFIPTGNGEDDFRASACDNQHNVLSADDLARFWMRFLGCGAEFWSQFRSLIERVNEFHSIISQPD